MKKLIPQIEKLRQDFHPVQAAALAHKEFVSLIARMVRETQKDYLRLFLR